MQKKAMLNSICIPVSAWQALLKHSSEWRSVAPNPDKYNRTHGHEYKWFQHQN
jgi:hypothetical protein